jgi:hypothetical protein
VPRNLAIEFFWAAVFAREIAKTTTKGGPEKKMACVLAEAERVYGAHGVPFFTLTCALVEGKKTLRFPQAWQRADAKALRARNKNAVCVRTGFDASLLSLVVVDADGDAAIATFECLARRAGVDLARVPQVQTQRGATFRRASAFTGAAQC